MARAKMPAFNDFDPNGTGSVEVWGVWTGSGFYVRPQRGGCITKMSRCSLAKLYQLTAEGWICHAVKDLTTRNDTCDMCHLHGVEDAWQSYYDNPNTYSWSLFPSDAWKWERKGGSIIKPPKLWFLCPGCVTRTGW